MNKTKTSLQIALILAMSASLYAQDDAPSQRLKKPLVTSGSNADALPEVVVSGTASHTLYGPPPTTSFTGITSPVEELPVTINTVTGQFIDDVSAHRVRDLVGYIPGVNASEDSGGTGDLLNIRGFDFIYQTYVNGMRNRLALQASREFTNIDHIEIFKGPGGVEFGVGDPGGFVNYVTKKPQATSSLTLGTEIGSYHYYEGYLDATGPLWTPAQQSSSDGKDAKDAKDGKTVLSLASTASPAPEQKGLFYRFIVSGDSTDSFRDTYHGGRVMVAPSLLYNYAPGSSVLVEFQYGYHDQPYDRGTIYMEGAGFTNNFAPIYRSYHEPGDFLDSHDTRTSAYWTHKLNDYISLRLTGEVNTTNTLGDAVRSPYTYLNYIPGTNTWNGDPTVLRTTQYFKGHDASYGIKPEVLLNFDTGPVKHTGLLGFNYLYTLTHTESQDGFDLRPIDLFNPFYGLPPIIRPAVDPTNPLSIPSRARDFRLIEDIEEYGVYYQHKMDIFKRLHLLAGVRYDWYRDDLAYTTNVRSTPLGPLQGYSDANLSFRVGGVLDVFKNVSLFLSYSNSFQPQQGLLASGANADALEATSLEGGIKANFFNNRLQSTLSIYQTTRKNVLEADPTDPTFTFVIPLGTVRVRGVEYELTGKLTDDLDIQGGFAVMQSKITESGDPTTQGKEFYNVPKAQAGVRLRYDTSRWLVDGLSVGAGVVYVGNREGDATNSFVLPHYVRFDAGLYYRWRNWKFKLTCENIADTRYYLASQGEADIIQPGAPRTFAFGAEVKF